MSRRWSRHSAAVASIVVVAVAVGLISLPGASAGPGAADVVRATVTDASGNVLGQVRFMQDGDRVVVGARLSGLTPGFHGFHVHSVGICDPAVGFTTAGGHWDPAGTGMHGQHAGDMPPLLVADDGTAGTSFATDRVTLEGLQDADGSAVIVHAGPDNLAHIPATTADGAERYHSHVEDVFGPDSATMATGDAGARFGCGVVTSQD